MFRFFTALFTTFLFLTNLALAGVNQCWCSEKERCGCEAPAAEQTCADDSHTHGSPAVLTASEACVHTAIPFLLPAQKDQNDSLALHMEPSPGGLFHVPCFCVRCLLRESAALTRKTERLPLMTDSRSLFGLSIACRC